MVRAAAPLSTAPSALAGGKGTAVFRPVLRGTAGRDRLVDGWLDGAVAGARDRASSRDRSRETWAGLVLIAPAPDFTEELMWKGFSPEVKQEIETKGVWLRPSQYGEPYPITRALIEEGRNPSAARQGKSSRLPGAHLAGRAGPGRAVATCLRAGAPAASDDVVLTVIQDGDHRLSRPQDIARSSRRLRSFSRPRCRCGRRLTNVQEKNHERHRDAAEILRCRRGPRRRGVRRAVHRGRRLSRRVLWRVCRPGEDR